MARTAEWIERLSALHRSTMRRFAQQEGLQMVHLEILIYLTRCNRYSDTTQALSEYMGQTKGSISQSIGFLETEGFLKRKQDDSDRRVFHLIVTLKGKNLVARFDDFFDLPTVDLKTEALFEKFLSQLQAKNDRKGFGLCSTCRYNQNPKGDEFVCGLTKERLSVEDTRKLCREHETTGPHPKSG